VLKPPDEQSPDSAAPVNRTNTKVAHVPVNIFTGILQPSNDKTGYCPITDSNKVSGREIGECFKKDRSFPWVYKGFFLDGNNRLNV
jgi:hypothetical protein